VNKIILNNKALLLIGPLMACIVMSGCQDQNSFTGDADRYAPLSSSGDLTTCAGRLSAARAIFQPNCASCHPSFVSYSYREWVDVNYLETGDAEASTVFYRLRGSGVGNNQNMPPSGQLEATEDEVIRQWINESASCL
jgi:hypothetical protein